MAGYSGVVKLLARLIIDPVSRYPVGGKGDIF